MVLNFNSQANIASLFQFSDSIEDVVKKTLNCCRVAIVDEFYPDDMVVKVHLVNKLLIGLNADGSQETIDYAPIYAKVHFIGWGETGITYPIQQGSEGILLFADREIESWYVNGDVNNLSYGRTHDITDAIFICGVYSMPNLINYVADCLRFFYKGSEVQLKDGSIDISTTAVNIDNTLNADTVNVGTGASGTFTSYDGKSITVTNGIVTNIV